jgi:hypothetical protein
MPATSSAPTVTFNTAANELVLVAYFPNIDVAPGFVRGYEELFLPAGAMSGDVLWTGDVTFLDTSTLQMTVDDATVDGGRVAPAAFTFTTVHNFGAQAMNVFDVNFATATSNSQDSSVPGGAFLKVTMTWRINTATVGTLAAGAVFPTAGMQLRVFGETTNIEFGGDIIVTLSPPLCFHPTASVFEMVSGTEVVHTAAADVDAGDLVRTYTPSGEVLNAVVHTVFKFAADEWVRFPRDAFGPGVPVADVLVTPRHQVRSPMNGTMHTAAAFLRAADRGAITRFPCRMKVPPAAEHVAVLLAADDQTGRVAYNFLLTDPQGDILDDSRTALTVAVSGMFMFAPGPRKSWILLNGFGHATITASLDSTDLQRLQLKTT